MEQPEDQMRRAIGTLLQSDPLIKLLQEVRLGRMKATDPGLRAVTESWMAVYSQVLQSQPVSADLLPRLDPTLGFRCWSMPGCCPGTIREPRSCANYFSAYRALLRDRGNPLHPADGLRHGPTRADQSPADDSAGGWNIRCAAVAS